MNLKNICMIFALAIPALPVPVAAQERAPVATVVIQPDKTSPVINRDIFGQFAEHLGEGIYGGVWVGKESKIPNVRGIRSDVVAALRAIKVPVVRWPGGCFADEYNWRNGIGPATKRVETVNGNWGNVIEPNSFGTHEFMDLLDQIGSEAYINVNLGTGTPREAADWLEYMTTDQPSALGKERAANGRKAPYRIKYLGIGNESWACGGNMSADHYVEELKQYSTFVRNLNPAQDPPHRYVRGPKQMQRIAVGPEDDKPEYTEAVMKAWQSTRPWRWGFEGLSLHHYTMGATPMSSPATGFDAQDYAVFVQQTFGMDTLIAQHAAIMDKYDPEKKVAMVVDEWGTWLGPMADTNPRFLKQQNSLRDAILASLNLNIFARHADRVRMANIAQMVNVLQAMILTDKEKMLLTPTYHIFKMYLPFQDAQLTPLTLETGTYRSGKIGVPQVDGVAAQKDGVVWLALTNIDPDQSVSVRTSIKGKAVRQAVGHVLTADKIDSINTFDRPAAVAPQPFSAKAEGDTLSLTLPARSVTVVRLDP
ncbi:alpha-N-arabinofuranosidase [Sphingobium boeckii]|uniref:non-reducing end alpha-L-arabinofuranosidase n=1 Tax=Sphingobium boeckii TaxID=1082345 RepID=A0A7W9AHZ4_9SPHN|nr:alpha-L-arabinofuranosidase C-terminal domain-containing protein [Sphingobium boeckii]MBB5685950.1 alpha-N-arabinofuranosidase [Sphingobium boeckii]